MQIAADSCVIGRPARRARRLRPCAAGRTIAAMRTWLAAGCGVVGVLTSSHARATPNAAGAGLVADPMSVGAAAPMSVVGQSPAAAAVATVALPVRNTSWGTASATDVSGRFSFWSSQISLRLPPVWGIQPSFGTGYHMTLSGASLWSHLGLDWTLEHLHVGTRLTLSTRIEGSLGSPNLVESSFVQYADRRWDLGLQHLKSWPVFTGLRSSSELVSVSAGVRPLASGPTVRASTSLDLRSTRSASRISMAGVF